MENSKLRLSFAIQGKCLAIVCHLLFAIWQLAAQALIANMHCPCTCVCACALSLSLSLSLTDWALPDSHTKCSSKMSKRQLLTINFLITTLPHTPSGWPPIANVNNKSEIQIFTIPDRAARTEQSTVGGAGSSAGHGLCGFCSCRKFMLPQCILHAVQLHTPPLLLQ